MAAVIEVDNLSKSYGHNLGIADLSFACEQGEIFGFLGPNGSGKTTTIRVLLDLLRGDSGQARLFGLDSHRYSRLIRSRLGNLPGGFVYDKRLTARQMLRLFAQLRGLDSLASAQLLAERFHVDLDRRLGQLSRGNLQKVGLIQALFHDPELLILDEPTSGLDPLMQQEFLNLIGERRALGATIFFSSHELDEVERVCDRAAMIGNGRLMAIEEIADLHARALRHFVVGFTDGSVDSAPFANLQGVSDLAWRGDRLHFSITGSSNEAVRLLARYQLKDIEIRHPSVEELFLSYYHAQ